MHEYITDPVVRKNKKFNFFIDKWYTQDLYVLCAGHADCGLGDIRTAKNRYHYYSLHYVVAGKGHLISNERQFELGAGDVFLIFRNEPTQHYPDPDDPWEIFWINFSGTAVEKLLARLDLSPDSPYLHFDNPQTISDIIQIYVRIVQAHTKKTICDLRALAALYELCSLICEEKLPKSFEAAVPLTYSVHIDKALTYIENNYSKKELSLTEVADYLNLHPNYFSTLFHESTKMRFSDYLRQFRVHKAMEITTAETTISKRFPIWSAIPTRFIFPRNSKKSSTCLLQLIRKNTSTRLFYCNAKRELNQWLTLTIIWNILISYPKLFSQTYKKRNRKFGSFSLIDFKDFGRFQNPLLNEHIIP